ncbi:MAG: extracellular solute-binding protein [Gammaproteobacteria bacterium]|nr:extracellular solute-binding protein [Gammaproteobacteria bacterium]
MFNKISRILMFVLVFALFACDQTQKSDHSASVSNSAEQAESSELVLYSSRNEQLILPLIEAYEAETGTRVKFVTDKPEPLIEKLKAEAELTPADVLMTVDAGNLWRASQADLFMSLESEVLEKAIPTNLRDENMQWFGFSQRARTIVYSVERVKPEELSTYENLANEKWHGKLCLRTSKKVYNQSLVAMLIATHGTGVTENIITGWVNNLATDPFSNDTKTMQAILAGQCDVAIVNTYYFGRMQKQDPQLALKLFWPNQNEAPDQLSGVHVNISGAGVLKHAKHPEQAMHFMEWMAGARAQEILAKGNMEYPVVSGVANDPLVESWGSFKADEQTIALAGELQAEAVMLMDRVEYR